MINYVHPRRQTSQTTAVSYVHPTRPRTNPTPDADGVIRLRKGESVRLA